MTVHPQLSPAAPTIRLSSARRSPHCSRAAALIAVYRDQARGRAAPARRHNRWAYQHRRALWAARSFCGGSPIVNGLKVQPMIDRTEIDADFDAACRKARVSAAQR